MWEKASNTYYPYILVDLSFSIETHMFDNFKVGDIIITYEIYNQRYINRIIYIDEHHMCVVQIKSIDNGIDSQDNNKVVTYYKDTLRKHEILTDELALEFL